MSELKFEDLPEKFCSITVYPEGAEIYAAVNGGKFDSEDHFLIKCDKEFSSIQEIRMVSWYAHIQPARMGGAKMCVHDEDVARENILAIARRDYAQHKLRTADHYERALEEFGREMSNEERLEITGRITSIRKKYSATTPNPAA